ncbi:MAG: hypothetical protein Q7S39_01540 [Ignavibacteria bacterium]|nr:hypothetical protein [Ignavibacteria bacterium]
MQKQIEVYKPKMIICNGADVCRRIKEIIHPISEVKGTDTYYIGEINGSKVTIVLSGFIGRIDNYSKRRLGKEIELLIATEKHHSFVDILQEKEQQENDRKH